MTAAGILTLLTGIFQFPGTLVKLITMLRQTPEAQHEALVNAMSVEATKYQATGRPTW